MQTAQNLKRFAPLALGVGLVALLIAGSWWLVKREMDVYVQGGLAVAVLGLALAVLLNPEAVQTWLMGRQARYGGNVTVMVVALMGILVIVNYIAFKNPQQWDWTQDQSSTLAPETLTALKQLSEPVKVVWFYDSLAVRSGSTESSAKLLDRYQAVSAGNFAYEEYNIEADPITANQYNVTRAGLVLQMGEQRQDITSATEQEITEQEITGALIRLMNPTTRAVYFLTGHGEKDIAESGQEGISQVADLLKKQNYDVRSLNLVITTTIPADARALVVMGALAPLSAEEVALLKTYLAGGGALIVAFDPTIQFAQGATEAPEPLADYLAAEWGITPRRDLIIDPTRSVPENPIYPVATQYEASPITSKLSLVTAFPAARSLGLSASGALPNVTLTPLVNTSPDAWGETDFQNTSPTIGEGDAVGPLTMVASAENAQTKARLVVFGDSEFPANGFANLGGADLFINSLNWVATEENLLNLTPKIPTTRTLVVSDGLTVNLIFFFVVIVMPLAVLVAGGVVWFLRRRHV